MKVQTAPRLGIIDALASGLRLAAQRPWLMIIPIAIDTALWLMPRLSVEALLMRLLVAWEALLQAAYTPTQQAAMADLLGLVRDAATQIGQQADIAMSLTRGWLALPSALATVQTSRLLLVSDGVLAPLGLGFQFSGAQPFSATSGAIGIEGIGGVLLVGAGFWLAAQVLATFYLRWAATSLDGTTIEHDRKDSPKASITINITRVPLLRLFTRLLGLSLLLGAVLLFLRVPLATVTSLTMMSGSSGTGFLFILSGGLTLWLTMSFLVSMFFASDAMLLEGAGLLPGIWRSLILARASGLRTLGFVALVNLLMLGARAMWGLIGKTPLGIGVAIVGNAYLASGMVLASMICYDGLRREWQAAVADKAGK